LKKQLKLLEELQRHDARLQDIDSQLKALPQKLEQMRSDLARVDTMLAQERAKLAEAEKWRGEQETQLKAEEEAIVKAKLKLQSVRTSREHMAADRELKTTSDMKKERETEILKLLEAIDSSKKTIVAHESDVGALREEVARQEEAIKAEIVGLTEQAAALRQDRVVLAKDVRPDVLKRYSSIRIRRGLAVVPVQEGVCQGCHMAVPPQLYNMLQRGTSIELCPQCARIIYWGQLMEEPPAEAAAPPAAVAEATAPAPAPSEAEDDPAEPAASSGTHPDGDDPVHKAASES
jgi:hypothetical protein